MNNLQPAIFLVPVIAIISVVLMYFFVLKNTADKKVFKRLIMFIAVLSFLLNFVWELLHLPLYKVASYDIQHISFCALASVADMLMVLLLYLCFAILYKKPFWLQHKGFQREFILMIIGAFGAIIAEIAHTSAGNWAYADTMPMLPFFNVGISPILQFMLLPAFTYYLSFYFLKNE